MHIQFYGIYGIENIKTINKHRLELEELDKKSGPDHDSHKDYKRMTKILDEIHYNYEEPWIYANYSGDIEEYFLKEKHVNWFVENKCCWKDKQYRLDRYYKIHLDMAPWPAYMVIVVLKQVMYIEGYNELEILIMGKTDMEVWQQPPQGFDPPIPPIGFKRISEKDDEFKDAYIVVRKG